MTNSGWHAAAGCVRMWWLLTALWIPGYLFTSEEGTWALLGLLMSCTRALWIGLQTSL